jgi:hypothetical protein
VRHLSSSSVVTSSFDGTKALLQLRRWPTDRHEQVAHLWDDESSRSARPLLCLLRPSLPAVNRACWCGGRVLPTKIRCGRRREDERAASFSTVEEVEQTQERRERSRTSGGVRERRGGSGVQEGRLECRMLGNAVRLGCLLILQMQTNHLLEHYSAIFCLILQMQYEIG